MGLVMPWTPGVLAGGGTQTPITQCAHHTVLRSGTGCLSSLPGLVGSEHPGVALPGGVSQDQSPPPITHRTDVRPLPHSLHQVQLIHSQAVTAQHLCQHRVGELVEAPCPHHLLPTHRSTRVMVPGPHTGPPHPWAIRPILVPSLPDRPSFPHLDPHLWYPSTPQPAFTWHPASSPQSFAPFSPLPKTPATSFLVNALSCPMLCPPVLPMPCSPQPYRSAAFDECQAVLLEVCQPVGHCSLWDNTDTCKGLQGRRNPLPEPYRGTGHIPEGLSETQVS